jgi:HK97 gp10 family phage protein
MFKVEGMDALLEGLDKLGKNAINAQDEALKKAGEVFQKEIIKEAPEDTGNLKDNIDIGEIKGEGKEKTIEVGNNEKAFYALFIEAGTKNMKADPFMGRAYESKKNEAQDTIANVIKKELNL